MENGKDYLVGANLSYLTALQWEEADFLAQDESASSDDELAHAAACGLVPEMWTGALDEPNRNAFPTAAA